METGRFKKVGKFSALNLNTNANVKNSPNASGASGIEHGFWLLCSKEIWNALHSCKKKVLIGPKSTKVLTEYLSPQ